MADFNGDGIADLMVGSHGAQVLLGTGNGAFTVPGFSGPAEALLTSSVAVRDFNGDGSPDGVAASASSASYVSLWDGPVAGFIGNLIGTSSLGPGVAAGF